MGREFAQEGKLGIRESNPTSSPEEKISQKGGYPFE